MQSKVISFTDGTIGFKILAGAYGLQEEAYIGLYAYKNLWYSAVCAMYVENGFESQERRKTIPDICMQMELLGQPVCIVKCKIWCFRPNSRLERRP